MSASASLRLLAAPLARTRARTSRKNTLTQPPCLAASLHLCSAGGHNDIIDSFDSVAAAPAPAVASTASLFGTAPAAAASPAADSMFGTDPGPAAGAPAPAASMFGAAPPAAAAAAAAADDDLFSMLDDGQPAGGAGPAGSSSIDMSSYINSNIGDL